MKLINQTRNNTICENVIEATSLFDRARGLLGYQSLTSDSTMWIAKCNSIHTWFMKFPIDVVFVDRGLVVKKVITNLRPWRITFPVWSADSVFEFNAGIAKNQNIQPGDQLYVGR
ncbi:MAG: DUF192 domain-containing protein [Pseudobdellovibrionaceae bacterium]|nr:DUF192 domain-containing protein [Bdellovibrionales bacterium]USN47215.1 MAG: DUF192 domain-containing protein [Pseudobdellovibrionaceae bacterium]